MDGPQSKTKIPTPLPIHKLLLQPIESKSISERGAWWTFFHSKIRLTSHFIGSSAFILSEIGGRWDHPIFGESSLYILH